MMGFINLLEVSICGSVLVLRVHYLQKNSGRLIFRHFLSHFGHLAET